jgi:RND family efflux transporter MFP subunit
MYPSAAVAARPGARGALILIAAALAGCGGGGATDRERVSLENAGDVEPAPAQATVDPGFLGVVVTGEATDIEPTVEGRIRAVLVKDGESVARGAPLVRMDVETAAYDLDMAQAALIEARRRFGRRQRLARSGAAAAEELDSARREMVQGRTLVAKLRRALAASTVVAPFAGRVAERFLPPGALAGPGRAVIRLVGRCAPSVRFAIPEERAGELALDAPVSIEVAPAGQRLPGKVTGLSPEVDASSRMVMAVAALDAGPGAPGALTTGLIARVWPAGAPAAR